MRNLNMHLLCYSTDLLHDLVCGSSGHHICIGTPEFGDFYALFIFAS